MQSVSFTELYDLLSQKLGKTEAKTLVDFVEAKVEKSVEDKSRILATKEDLFSLRVDIEKSFRSQTQWMAGTFIAIVILILGLYATVIFT